MTGDLLDPLFGETLDRWSDLDTDWQGVIVAAAIAVLVDPVGISAPW
ncbi:MAG: hypothetical protein V5A36_01170 [Natronomonas sp.]